MSEVHSAQVCTIDFTYSYRDILSTIGYWSSYLLLMSSVCAFTIMFFPLEECLPRSKARHSQRQHPNNRVFLVTTSLSPLFRRALISKLLSIFDHVLNNLTGCAFTSGCAAARGSNRNHSAPRGAKKLLCYCGPIQFSRNACLEIDLFLA